MPVVHDSEIKAIDAVKSGAEPQEPKMSSFVKAKRMSLKAHTFYSEKWLQKQLERDPSLLGLGDLEVKEVERRQPHAGRLDMLLIDPETTPPTRYEVEIQL